MLKFIFLLKRLKNFKFKKYYNAKYKKVPLKLHLGCGTQYKKSWINIDNNSDRNIKQLDINYNLAKGIPFKDSSVDYIYNEHFIEHLTVEEGLLFLKECKRVLKKGGILRIATPDLAEIIKFYNNENWKEDCYDFFNKFNLNFVKTRAEVVNMDFHWWGHKWLYDKEELERRLKESGFKNIKFCNINESDYSELCGLETRDESNLIAEAVKE